MGPVTTNSDSLQWGVTFDKPVYGVSAADFALAGAGVTGTIASLTGGGTSYIVTVSDVCGTGTLGLNLVDDDSIVDEAGNPLGGPGAGNGNFTGQAFNVVVSLPWSTTGTNFTATEGQASISGVVAAFTDSRGIYSAGDYTSTSLLGRRRRHLQVPWPTTARPSSSRSAAATPTRTRATGQSKS